MSFETRPQKRKMKTHMITQKLEKKTAHLCWNSFHAMLYLQTNWWCDFDPRD